MKIKCRVSNEDVTVPGKESMLKKTENWNEDGNELKKEVSSSVGRNCHQDIIFKVKIINESRKGR